MLYNIIILLKKKIYMIVYKPLFGVGEIGYQESEEEKSEWKLLISTRLIKQKLK